MWNEQHVISCRHQVSPSWTLIHLSESRFTNSSLTYEGFGKCIEQISRTQISIYFEPYSLRNLSICSKSFRFRDSLSVDFVCLACLIFFIGFEPSPERHLCTEILRTAWLAFTQLSFFQWYDLVLFHLLASSFAVFFILFGLWSSTDCITLLVSFANYAAVRVFASNKSVFLISSRSANFSNLCSRQAKPLPLFFFFRISGLAASDLVSPRASMLW